ncbi:SDR family oxidoreductase [Clostridium swellfunianum]|uniref:SDR family oxidoreductase n=1 Tax=Clostridium swellfunianum TaxID=1367462 RepID=UPI00202FD433|nr:SDR family oxidoreductase [Clostridium swellfunianum]MCM0647184.1 SDR family oxidoreductase [Clostridium swellfunianum]
MKDSKVVLVTGASSGLGLAVATHLEKMGYTVYAGARSFKDKDKAQISTSSVENHNKIYLDVTDEESASHAVDMIVNKEGKLDILINCAAFLVLGSVEDTSVDEYKGVLETNFLGTVRMCQKVLPIMRKQKEGRIINFSSINGLMATPFQSAYTASKFAIEGMTEALSIEVQDYGIKVTLIEPSDHRSGSKNYRPHAKKADLKTSAYYDTYIKVTSKFAHDEDNGSYPEKLAEVVYKITQKKNPNLRYTVGKIDQRLSAVLKRILPARIFEKIIRGYYY